MIVRPAEATDYAGIRRVLVAAFPSVTEADLVEQLRRDGDAAIELVAEIDGKVVGHVLFSPMDAPFRALALGPVAADPAHQQGGVGRALIEAGHELARADGWDGIFVLGEPDYYARFGYSAEAARPFDCIYAGHYFMLLALAPPLPSSGEVQHAPAFAGLG